jgi:hypothetical protein
MAHPGSDAAVVGCRMLRSVNRWRICAVERSTRGVILKEILAVRQELFADV